MTSWYETIFVRVMAFMMLVVVSTIAVTAVAFAFVLIKNVWGF